MEEKNRPIVVADAVNDIHNVAETLSVLNGEAMNILMDSPVATWEILRATLSSQIDSLDKIGLSLAEEFDKAVVPEKMTAPEEPES